MPVKLKAPQSSPEGIPRKRNIPFELQDFALKRLNSVLKKSLLSRLFKNFKRQSGTHLSCLVINHAEIYSLKWVPDKEQKKFKVAAYLDIR
jgi:hypothetical protein